MAGFVKGNGQLRSPLHLTFFHNYTEIIADGSFREVKDIRNFFIAFSFGDQTHDIPFVLL